MHTATQTPSRLGQFLSILEECWTDHLLSSMGHSVTSLLEDSAPCFHKFWLSSRSVAPRVMYLVQYQPFWRA